MRPLAPDPAPRWGVRGGLGPPSKQVERGNGGRRPRTKQECTSEAHLVGARGQVAPESKQVERGYGGSRTRTKHESTSEAHLAGVRGQVAPESETIGKFYPVILNGVLLEVRSARPSVKRVTFVVSVNADNRVFSRAVDAVCKYAILGD